MTHRGQWPLLALLAMLAALHFSAAPACAQPPPWAGEPIAQPYFDPPWQARYQPCLPEPLPWTFDPGDPADACDPCSPLGPDAGRLAHRPSSLYARAEFTPLTYDYNGVRMATRGIDGPQVLSTSDLDFEFDAGGTYLLGWAFAERWRLEGSYLGNYAWEDNVVAHSNDPNIFGSTGNFMSPFSGFGLPPDPVLDFNSLVELDQVATFSSAELNVLYRFNLPPGPFDLSFLVGARHVSFDDNFTYRTLSAVPAPGGAGNLINVRTTNELWGAQLGFLGQWLIAPRAWADLDVRGALCTNRATMASAYTLTDSLGTFAMYNGAAEQDRTTFVGDISLVGNYQLTTRLSFRVGYRATWLNGVALGVDNMGQSIAILRSGPYTVNDRGENVIHGPTLGLTWTR